MGIDFYYLIVIVVLLVMSCIAFFIGKRLGGDGNAKLKLQELTAQVTSLTADRDVQKALKEEYAEAKKNSEDRHEKELHSLKENCDKALVDQKVVYETQLQNLRCDAEADRKAAEEHGKHTLNQVKESYEAQIKDLKESFDKQLAQVKHNSDSQLEALREMSQKQVENQLALIKEQMRTTSEDVLKARQVELGVQNTEQVSKIIDPLQKSLKDMEEALNRNKEQQQEALTRLDQTIKQNMEKSASLGETADRLTRALTGEVKVQGNFGELKLKQLLERMELKEGEQFDTQETLRDIAGKGLKGDDGKGMIPDFILHFPNNRHVVVDSKMSLTDYERYMSAEDGTPAKSGYLKAHIDSVRAQVKRLSKKDYTAFLPKGYNRLNFAIMYVPIEGALNLALLNDNTLWKEAYDEGVMILGPQTMYMNLRVLEMMWTQVRQLKNQQEMMDAASQIIDRVQDFGIRFVEVEKSMNDTVGKIRKLKITTADSGASIITAAKNLIKAGAKENNKKKSLVELEEPIFIDSDHTQLLTQTVPAEATEVNDASSELSTFEADEK